MRADFDNENGTSCSKGVGEKWKGKQVRWMIYLVYNIHDGQANDGLFVK